MVLFCSDVNKAYALKINTKAEASTLKANIQIKTSTVKAKTQAIASQLKIKIKVKILTFHIQGHSQGQCIGINQN